MDLPKQLKERFEDRGWCFLKEFAQAAGITYPNAVIRAHAGDIPAVNVASKESKRASWRLYEEPVREWFQSRSNQPVASEVPA